MSILIWSTAWSRYLIGKIQQTCKYCIAFKKPCLRYILTWGFFFSIQILRWHYCRFWMYTAVPLDYFRLNCHILTYSISILFPVHVNKFILWLHIKLIVLGIINLNWMIIPVFNRMGKIFLICSPQINIIYSTIALIIIISKKNPPYEILSISSNTVKTSLTFLITIDLKHLHYLILKRVFDQICI